VETQRPRAARVSAVCRHFGCNLIDSEFDNEIVGSMEETNAIS